MKLLNDIVQNIPEKQLPIRAGRPELSMQDMVFGSALKVFTTFSLRRFMTDANEAKVRGYLQHIPHFTLVSVYMKKEEMTPILQDLITLSALPMKAVETKFAIDSTGFRTSKFSEYCHIKYGTNQRHSWLKAHLCIGVKTNVITAIEITDENGADSPKFIPLVNTTYQNGFDMKEVSADKAYSSRDNLNVAAQNGGLAYIPFKSNAVGNPRGKSRLWRNMFYYFQMNQEDFMQHYHKRSNVETTNMAIKTKLGDCLKNKNFVSQSNELLCKLIAYNITVLINSMYELGIKPEFIA